MRLDNTIMRLKLQQDLNVGHWRCSNALMAALMTGLCVNESTGCRFDGSIARFLLGFAVFFAAAVAALFFAGAATAFFFVAAAAFCCVVCAGGICHFE